MSVRGDFVSVSPDSTLGGGPGIELVLLSAIIFLYVLFICLFYFIFYLFILPSRVTLSFNVPAYVIWNMGKVYALTLLAWLLSAS